MSAWTDARDNVRHGLVAMWAGFTPIVRTAIIASCTGFLLGAGFATWVTW